MFKRLSPYWNKEDDYTGTEQEEVQEEQEVLEEEEQEEQIEEEVQEEKVPLKKFLSEKQRRKEVEKKLRELEDKQVDSEVITKRNSIKDKYIKAGYDEELASMLAEDIASVYKDTKKKDTDTIFDEEIADLVESDSLYKDAHLYKEQIRPLMKNGLSAEEAYIKLRGKTILREARINQEQVSLGRRKEVENKNVPVSKGGGKATNPYPLDDKDRSALKSLQESFPDAGWTAEKYYKTIYKE